MKCGIMSQCRISRFAVIIILNLFLAFLFNYNLKYVTTLLGFRNQSAVETQISTPIKPSHTFMKHKRNENILFFNRVPKTGSEMMDLILKWLRDDNHFHLHRLKNSKKRHFSSKERLKMVEEVLDVFHSSEEDLLVVDQHVYFTNFTEFGHSMPVYFSLVRDPVDKLISRFYYARVTPRPGGFTPPGYISSSTPKYPSLEDCVAAGDSECQFIVGQFYDLTIPYFCGHEQFCRELGNLDALALAKQHVEEWYPVVGVLEDLNITLTTLEAKLPQFFRGAKVKYYEGLRGIRYNKNRQKPCVTEAVRTVLRHNLSLEYDFYHYIKARLQQQYTQHSLR